MERRLSTIRVADVVDYSAQMGSAEAQTIQKLYALGILIDRHVQKYEGRVFNRAVAAMHLDSETFSEISVRALFIMDPDFSPAGFLATEFYRENSRKEQLNQDLNSACALRATLQTM